MRHSQIEGLDGLVVEGQWMVLDHALGERLGFSTATTFRSFLAKHRDAIEAQGGKFHRLAPDADQEPAHALNMVAAIWAAKIAETPTSGAVESALFFTSMMASKAIQAATDPDPAVEAAMLRAKAHKQVGLDLAALRDRIGPSDVLDREIAAHDKQRDRLNRAVLRALCDVALLERVDINTSAHEHAIAMASLPAYVLFRAFEDPDRGVEPLRQRIERHVGYPVTRAAIDLIFDRHREAGYLENRDQGLRPQRPFRDRARRDAALDADAEAVRTLLDPLPRDRPVDAAATALAAFGDRIDPFVAYVAASAYAAKRRIYYIQHGLFNAFSDPLRGVDVTDQIHAMHVAVAQAQARDHSLH